MLFKNVLFLYLLPLIFLPLLLHLFFIKFIKVYLFPWLGFIPEKEDEMRKRKKIKELLLLISRTLFLFFLLISLSSPFFKKGPFPDFIVFDSSESTLLYRNKFRDMEKRISNTFGRENLLKEKSLITEDKKGTIFVITDGDEDFFENIRVNTARFFIFLPDYKEQDIGIWKAVLKDGKIDVSVYSYRDIPDAVLKVIADGNPFSFNVKLKKGITDLSVPIKVDNFRLLKVQILPYDSLPEDNLYFISRPLIKKYYKVFGNPSDYLEKLLTNMGYKKIGEIVDSSIYIFYGIPHNRENLKILNEFINSNKPCVLFIDRENELMETSLKESVNIRIKNEIIYFSEIFDINEGKPIFEQEGITYASLYKNTLVFGFLPEPEYTQIVYSPSFLHILKQGIKNLKIKTPEVINVTRDTFVYFDSRDYRIYDSEGNFLKKDRTGQGKINFNGLPYGSYIIRNAEELYIDLNFSKKEIPIKKVTLQEIKDVLPNAEVHRWNELGKFMPVSIKGFSFFLALFFILIEIFLIVLL